MYPGVHHSSTTHPIAKSASYLILFSPKPVIANWHLTRFARHTAITGVIAQEPRLIGRGPALGVGVGESGRVSAKAPKP